MSHRRQFALSFLSALVGVVLAGSSTAKAEFLVALGSTSTLSNALITFDSALPSASSAAIGVTGVNGTLLEIDYRPNTGLLYGLSDTSQLYTINTTTGLASFVSTLSTSLSGSQFGIDFNPTVDRLRIVSNTGQNLRVNVDTGAVTVDTNLSATNVVGAAYTNSFPGSTATTLYDLTYVGNTFRLNTQNPPNNGTIVPVGSTGITSPSSLVGFDISGATGVAYVGFNNSVGVTGNIASLSTIDLTTGNISSVAQIDGAGFQIRGIAVNAVVPEPASLALLGIGLAGLGAFGYRRSVMAN